MVAYPNLQFIGGAVKTVIPNCHCTLEQELIV
jgi:hypothetical protein